MDSQWLKTQFQLHPDKSKADLAGALGLEPPAISKILSGQRQIKAQEYIAMRTFFGMPLDGEKSLKKNSNGYRLQPLEQDNMLQESGENDSEWVIPAGIISKRTQASPEQIKMFEVRETAMEPDFKQGEFVLVDLTDQKPSPPGVFIISDGYGHMIRHCGFVPKSETPTLKISASSRNFDAQTIPFEGFNIIGRVIAKLLMV